MLAVPPWAALSPCKAGKAFVYRPFNPSPATGSYAVAITLSAVSTNPTPKCNSNVGVKV